MLAAFQFVLGLFFPCRVEILDIGCICAMTFILFSSKTALNVTLCFLDGYRENVFGAAFT